MMFSFPRQIFTEGDRKKKKRLWGGIAEGRQASRQRSLTGGKVGFGSGFEDLMYSTGRRGNNTLGNPWENLDLGAGL